MNSRHSRRSMLVMAGAAGLLAGGGLAAHAAAREQRRTPGQILGPYYPITKPADTDADLTVIQGHTERARGQLLYVTGRVFNAAGAAQAGIGIEIWQANSMGRYTHPSDHNPAPLDPNFEGFARLTTDTQGRYRFKTIKPAAYPAGPLIRPAHIHFDVLGRINRLVTQMYFSGDPHNDSDPFLASAGPVKDRLIVSLEPPTPGMDADSRLVNWDIVLEDG